jgi:NADPH2:quinone reductase
MMGDWQMDAAVLYSVGEPPRFSRFEDPVAGDGEVIVEVRAAALNPSTKAVAAGSHYAAMSALPAIVGLDGMGVLSDGRRVFFGGPRKPFGTMAERAVARPQACWPVPDGVDDITAAALPNPALSSWLPLVHSAKLNGDETVLVLGATGTAGRLAIQVARYLGAGRVVAAGRDERILATLGELGADDVISLEAGDEELASQFVKASGDGGYDIILDYLWGRPVEILLTAMTQSTFHLKSSGPRLMQIGASAGADIRLSADSIRSAGLTIAGGGFPPPQKLYEIFGELMAGAAAGKFRIETRPVPLSRIEEAWNAPDDQHRRLVITPLT